MFPKGRCCLGDRCHNKNGELRPSHRCPDCKEICHSVTCSTFVADDDSFHCFLCLEKEAKGDDSEKQDANEDEAVADKSEHAVPAAPVSRKRPPGSRKRTNYLINDGGTCAPRSNCRQHIWRDQVLLSKQRKSEAQDLAQTKISTPKEPPHQETPSRHDSNPPQDGDVSEKQDADEDDAVDNQDEENGDVSEKQDADEDNAVDNQDEECLPNATTRSSKTISQPSISSHQKRKRKAITRMQISLPVRSNALHRQSELLTNTMLARTQKPALPQSHKQRKRTDISPSRKSGKTTIRISVPRDTDSHERPRKRNNTPDASPQIAETLAESTNRRDVPHKSYARFEFGERKSMFACSGEENDPKPAPAYFFNFNSVVGEIGAAGSSKGMPILCNSMVVAKRKPFKHIPSFYIGFARGFVLRSKGNLKPFCPKIIEFLLSIFNNKDDVKDIQQLFDKKEFLDYHYIFVYCCKSSSDGTVLAEDCGVVACLVCFVDETDGTAILWLGVDQEKRLDKDWVSEKQADRKVGFRQQGIGQVLVAFLHHQLRAATINTTLFAQINVEQDNQVLGKRHRHAASWYREKLFFAPLLEGTQFPEIFVARNVFYENVPQLETYHSTVFCTQWVYGWRQTRTSPGFGEAVDQVRSSYGMPPTDATVLQKRGKTNGVLEPGEYKKMTKCLQKAPDGVSLVDLLVKNPPSNEVKLNAEEDTLRYVWKKYADLANDDADRPKLLRFKDLHSGNLRGLGDKGEASCMYVCLSNQLLGSTSYYWRLRIASAVVCRLLAACPENCPIFDRIYPFLLGLLDEAEQQSNDEGEEEEEDDDGPVHDGKGESLQEECKRRLRRYSRQIIKATKDAGQLECIFLFSSWFTTYRQVSIFATTQEIRSKFPESRLWQCTLLESTGSSFLSETEDDDPEKLSVCIVGHVDGQHYVTAEAFDQSEIRPGEFIDNPAELVACYEKAAADKENVYFLEFEKRLDNELSQEFTPEQTDMHLATKHVDDISVRPTQERLQVYEKRRKMLSDLIASRSFRTTKSQERAKQKLDNYEIKVNRATARLVADTKNLDLEARLLLVQYTTSILYNGVVWMAVVDMGDSRGEVEVPVPAKWVEKNFVPEFISFVRTFGQGHNGFNPLPSNSLPEPVYCVDTVPKARAKVVSWKFYHYPKATSRNHFRVYHRRFDAEGQLVESLGNFRASIYWMEEELKKLTTGQRELERMRAQLKDLYTSDFTVENSDCFNTLRGKNVARHDEHNELCHRHCHVIFDEETELIMDFDCRQIHGLRYIDNDGRWEGICRPFKHGRNNEVVVLPPEWVEQNMGEDVRNACKRRSKTRKVFVKIPPGSTSRSTIFPSALDLENAPPIHYFQESRQTCVADSVASALYHMNHPDMAALVNKIGLTEKPKDFVDRVIQTLQHHGRHWQPHRIPKDSDLTVHDTVLTLILMESTDGIIGHAVATFGGWIFDSGFEKALPLCKASFDFLSGDGATFVGHSLAYRFHKPYAKSTKYKRLPKPKATEEENDDGCHPLGIL